MSVQVQGYPLSDTFHSAFQPAQHYQSQQQHHCPTAPTPTPSSSSSSAASHAPTPSFSMQDGLSGYPGWGDFSPFATSAHGAVGSMQRNMAGATPSQALSSTASPSSFRSPQQQASFFNDGSMRGGGGMSAEMSSSSVAHHQQHQQVPVFGQDGGGDKFGLNSSCSSDKFSTLDDMVSKLVDEESNHFSLNSLGHFSAAGAMNNASDDNNSQATSGVFSFDE